MQKFETIEVSLKGTLPQMMDRLHSLNDYSDNARQLCEVAEQLKKELINKGSEVKQLAKCLQQKTNECISLKSRKDENVIKVAELTGLNNKLRYPFVEILANIHISTFLISVGLSHIIPQTFVCHKE